YTPHFPFGYGLGYTQFQYSDLKISNETINTGDELKVSVTLKNTGDIDGDEVVQLYIQDLVGTITRHIKELKRFERVALKKGESKEVVLTISTDDLKFVNNTMKKVLEPGQFNLWVGSNSATGLKASFILK